MAWQATLLLHLFWLTTTAAAAPPETLEGCPTMCGNVSIPFPFGVGNNCFHPGFDVTCNSSMFNPPRLFLGTGNLQVLNIDPVEGLLRINHFIAEDCDTSPYEHNQPFLNLRQQAPYRLSSDRNKFVAIGCDTQAIIVDNDNKFRTGCVSICSEAKYVLDANGSCSGIGCCETRVPKGVRSFYVEMKSFNNHRLCSSFSPCSYAFLADKDSFKFHRSDLQELRRVKVRPLTLEWAIGNKTCKEEKAAALACVAEHSECYDAVSIRGYRCNCSAGFYGNPYLKGGCQDMDECSNQPYPCTSGAGCKNTEGNYTCSCPKGMRGDGRRDGTGCTPQFRYLTVVLASGLSLVFLTATVSWLYWALKKRKLIKLKEEFFKQNGGLLLQKRAPALTFTLDDLNKATDNFSDGWIIGGGGHGTVYRGELPKQGTVAVKKSKITDKNQIEQFINEVVVLSNINHRNVVKLLGCCLETEVPLLVYEFVSNGTLSHHIHDPPCRGSLSLEIRLRIASEAANALAYLHSSASIRIIHRDVKSGNILIDDKYIAKVADFGSSRLVPFDKNCINSLIQGTFGYLDPQYLLSGKFTDKSDVFSFGVVLVELLTGKKATSTEGNGNLADRFLSCVEEDRLTEILEDRVSREGHMEQLNAIADLASRCLQMNGDDRPTMKDVSARIEELRVNKSTGVEEKNQEIQ